MVLSARLNLRQTQSLVMTPQLLQSIRLLQLTHVELEQFIDEQIERNPLLTRGEAEAGSATESAAESVSAADLDTSAETIADRLDTSLENVFPDDPGRTDSLQHNGPTSPRDLSVGGEGSDYVLEEMATREMTLHEMVKEQIALTAFSPSERLIAGELAEMLDERGYVEFDPASLAERVGADLGQIDDVLDELQKMDPPGIFARDLRECLALQCARNDRLDPAMATLLDNLELLAKRDFKTLSRLCGVDEADLLDMLAEIRTLSPHPGRAYDRGPSEAIVHDVTVREASDGSWNVELNNDALPRVLLDKTYHANLVRGCRSAEDKAFVSQCLADATWLERSLDQRATTILKVAVEIVRQQDRFLVEGVSGLKPLTMKTVAEAIDVHESTVSRVTSNKYMMTPRGIFELRYFFTGAIGSSEGDSEEHAAESVRERIRVLIDQENPDSVYSDDQLVTALKSEGIDIARRTVAKYREGMGIASSVQRRREKRAMAKVRAAG